MMKQPLLLLIDGHSLAFRSYYAFATSRKGALRTATGIPTSICFGFLNSLLQVLELQQPEYVAIAFDREEPSFRHQADPNYKANRKETPEDFIPDLANLQELLTALNITITTVAGYEADDILATLTSQGRAGGYEVKILTGDRDLFQLVEDNISVLYLENRAMKSSSPSPYQEFNPEAVQAKMGVAPSQIVDYKALCGDPADNFPGVRGIGEKRAVKLLQEYGSFEGIYSNIHNIKGASKKYLEAGKKDGEHSRYLAQLHHEVPLNITLSSCLLQGFSVDAVQPLLDKLELKTFSKQLDRLQKQLGGTVTASAEKEEQEERQLSLFDDVAVEPSNPISRVRSQRTTLPVDVVEESSQKEPAPVSTPSPITPLIIDTKEKLKELITILETRRDKPVAWDTETTALNPMNATLVGIGCCWGPEPTEVAYIPTAHTGGGNLEKEAILELLAPILEREQYPKVLQNAKFDRIVLLQYGIKLAGVTLDTMLASYVLHPEQSHNLKDLCQRYLGAITAKSYKELPIPKGGTIADLDIPMVADYCGLDAYSTFLLGEKLEAELATLPRLKQLLLDIEQPLEAILAAMEVQGVRVDQQYLAELSDQLEVDLKAIEHQAYQEAGEEFNLASPKQLSEILFTKLGLDQKKSRQTKTGYSTNHAILEKLQGDHPVIDSILEHRTLAKLKSTYVDALPQLINEKTGRVHTNFNQAVTTTGRLSSSHPNLQNIPIRTELYRRIRQAFLPETDWLLVAADYSQIELRILAHLSQEPVLLEAYQNQADIHSVTAKLIFDKDKITPEERRLGKIINFGVIYGMGATRFAREAGVSTAEGKEFIERYRQKYQRVFAYLERVKREAVAFGFVTTIWGRRRYFDFASRSLTKLRGEHPDNMDLAKMKLSHSDAQLLRAAANAPIQGSSADLIKIAMVKLAPTLAQYNARLLLQVHDELVFEVPRNEWEELQELIQLTMEGAAELSVPLVVEVCGGNNWLEAK